MTKLVYIFLILLPSLCQANFTISPVKLVINKTDKVTSLTLKNDTQEPKSFQLVAFKIVHDDHANDSERDVETKDLLITPLSFKIAPGKTQVIRVALKNNSTIEELERAYRISIKELPHKTKHEGSHVQVVTEFKVPISITNTKPDTYED